MVTTRPPKTIVKPTALGPVANTDTKLLIYGLFQKGRVLAQDGSDRNRSFTRKYRRNEDLRRDSQYDSMTACMVLPQSSVGGCRVTHLRARV